MHGPVPSTSRPSCISSSVSGDATARFSAAFAGTALVFTPYFLRRWMDACGAVSASTLLVFSPTVLYYSRFIREDIFVALWTVGLFVSIWRYSRSGRQGGYTSRRQVLALGFANKELTFMLAAVALIYTDVLLAVDLSRRLSNRFNPAGCRSGSLACAIVALLIPVAWAVAVIWNPLRRWRRDLRLPKLPRSGDLLIIVGTLTLPQLCALVQIPFKHFGIDLNAAVTSVSFPPFVEQPFTLTREAIIGTAIVIALLAASAAAGISWNLRRWLLAALVLLSPIFVCLFTTFFTNSDGFATGIWGSLDYWLQQQDVQRGGQPVFYYLVMLPAYAYVSLTLAAIGVVYRAVRKGWLSAHCLSAR